MSKVTFSDTRPHERGAVSIKTLLALALVAVVAFLIIKIAPAYVEQREIIYRVDELARIAALRGWKDEKINEDIRRLSVEYNLPDNGINFVARTEKGVQIAVNYHRNIDLLVTVYEWKVDHTVVGKDYL